MRFARHAKIFRGPLDAAPVASVLMLLMMFMLLSSLVYTPGVLVALGQPITVTKTNSVVFAGKTYAPGDLDQLRIDLKNWPDKTGFSVVMDSGADPGLGRQVSNLFQIAMPDGKNLIGTDNATVMVAVNFRGQCFYENQPVQYAELLAKLAERQKIAVSEKKKLTMVLMADKATDYQTLTKLRALAREAGIADVSEMQRPPVSGGKP
jgi:biopolymer transport protein ExbD